MPAVERQLLLVDVSRAHGAGLGAAKGAIAAYLETRLQAKAKTGLVAMGSAGALVERETFARVCPALPLPANYPPRACVAETRHRLDDDTGYEGYENITALRPIEETGRALLDAVQALEVETTAECHCELPCPMHAAHGTVQACGAPAATPGWRRGCARD